MERLTGGPIGTEGFGFSNSPIHEKAQFQCRSQNGEE
jgi:hypothetical protein